MQDKKPPAQQGIVSYAQGIKARNAERAQEKKDKGPIFPNMAQASVEYDPSHGVKTLGQMADEQKAAAGGGPQKPAISQATVDGLTALKQAQERTMTTQPQPAVPPIMAAAAPSTPPPAAAPVQEEERLDDLELSTILAKMREDMLNNERERDAVEARLKPIDLSEGLMTGVFVQEVPIVPGALVVTFRCLSVIDHSTIRNKVYLMVRENPDLESASGELLGLLQTVATVKSINSTKFPNHLTQDKGKTVFDETIFEAKYQQFMAFPLPLISSLGIHSSWFDARVRKLFTSAEPIKNG